MYYFTSANERETRVDTESSWYEHEQIQLASLIMSCNASASGYLFGCCGRHMTMRPPLSHRYVSCLILSTVYPKKYAHGFVVLCFVVVMQSFIMNSHEVFIHIHQGCFAGTGAIVRLPQCQWSKPDGYGKISQCITTTKHSKNRVHISWEILYATLQS